MKILFPIAECEPFAKTGGLGDVGAALPLELFKKNIDVRVIMPFYRKVKEYFELQHLPLQKILFGKEVSFDKFYFGMKKIYSFNVYQSTLSKQSKAIIYFIDIAEFFDRPGLYVGEDGKAFPDSAEIYAYFAKAVFEFLLAMDWLPDIIHCHDWHTGLIPLMLKYSLTSIIGVPKTVFTIHNMAYQGSFPLNNAEKFGFDSNLSLMKDITKENKINFLKSGIISSDVVTTVSETYRDELLTTEFGNGLDDILREKSKNFIGILNGVDYQIWNPENDEYIKATYSNQNLQGKKECKDALWTIIKKYNKEIITQDSSIPIFSIVSRLDKQKGIDLLIEIIPELQNEKIHLIIVGSGNKKYEEKLKIFNEQTNFTFIMEFNNALAHQVEAGSDFFLMPSKYEPCGLNQMYSLKYGTFPIVRKTGGLADTIKDMTDSPNGNGFVFTEYSGQELKNAILRAKDFYTKTSLDELNRLRSGIMKKSFSWEKSVEKYINLYNNCVNNGIN